jgi:hypothetical protein
MIEPVVDECREGVTRRSTVIGKGWNRREGPCPGGAQMMRSRNCVQAQPALTSVRSVRPPPSADAVSPEETAGAEEKPGSAVCVCWPRRYRARLRRRMRKLGQQTPKHHEQGTRATHHIRMLSLCESGTALVIDTSERPTVGGRPIGTLSDIAHWEMWSAWIVSSPVPDPRSLIPIPKISPPTTAT